MAKEIRFSLVYRDMWQSSGKYVPRADQLVRIAPEIVKMGCFSRVETNGGGFEQINLLFGENPNHAVRVWTQPFNDAGIQTHMLDRSLNGIRLSPVPADVRKLMFKVKKKQGTDISRSFDGLNDVRNIADSIKYAKAGGMIAQAALSITYSAVHTVEYYVEMAEALIAAGAQELCIKDMAGIGRPVSLGKIVGAIKANHPDILIQYHGHSGPGLAPVSLLEVARAGADIIDVGMEPLSWGTGHTDLLTAHAILKDAGFLLPEINMDAYMRARALTQSFIDDFLGHYINPRNRLMNALLIRSGLPGGMMGSLMSDLEQNLNSLNKWLAKKEQPQLNQDELLMALFEEVEYIWPLMGYPPLVTPYSQYVKNVALMNVIQMKKGRKRWSMIADNVWDLMLGKSGKLPGTLAPELVALAKAQGKIFYEGIPQDLYPDELDTFSAEMKEKGWDEGQDQEELLELAMHPTQYRAYRSGKAKADFEEDLARRKAAKVQTAPSPAPVPALTPEPMPKNMLISVEGVPFRVSVSYDDAPETEDATQKQAPKTTQSNLPPAADKNHKPSEGGNKQTVPSPIEGKFFLTKTSSEIPLKVGDTVKTGDTIAYIESMKVYNAIIAESGGQVLEICFKNGDDVEEDDVLICLAD